MNRKEAPLLVVTGPTASGKTGRAVALAREFGGEIVSADSRQVYRRMDIGTGKDLEEYAGIPYHLIDICEPGTKYNLHRYLTDFNAALSDIRSRGCRPIVCGGTGLYLETALSGVRTPEVPCCEELRRSLQGKSLRELADILAGMKTLHNVTDIDTPKRAIRAIEIARWYQDHPEDALAADRKAGEPLDALIILVDIPRDARRERISERLRRRLDSGMVGEVRSLIDSGIAPDDLIYYGLEYKYLTLHVTGRMSLEEMTSRLEIEIHKFAKRQMTWFRGMERRGFTLHRLPYDMGEREFIEAVAGLEREHMAARSMGASR